MRLPPVLLVAGLAALASAQDAPPAAPAAEPPKATELTFLRVNEQGAEEWWRPRDGAVVVRVPGGSFLRRPYEGTVAKSDPRPVDVPSFLVDLKEVTNAQFARFLTAQPAAAEHLRADVPGLVRTAGGWEPAPGLAGHPVTACTGKGALAFAAWVGGRLPNAAEWEKAASGTDGRLYPWGDDAPDAARANFGRPALRGLAPAGSRPLGASPYGCLDMAGNAYERVMTKARSGDALPVMIKGGSWASTHPLNLRVLDLCMQSADVADATVGFRCVMDDPDPSRAPRTAPAAAPLRWTADFDAAVKEARERRVPIFLTLQLDTCGQCDRTRAQLFRDARFVAYCNERMVVVAGHVSGDALDDPHPAGEGGACPLYPGLTCAQHEAAYARGLGVVGRFVVSPGNFVLDPDATEKGAGARAVLVAEQRLAKWGDDVEGYLRAFDEARGAIAERDAARKDAHDGAHEDAKGE